MLRAAFLIPLAVLAGMPVQSQDLESQFKAQSPNLFLPLEKSNVKGTVYVNWVQHNGNQEAVDVEGEPFCENAPKRHPKVISAYTIQVWLLRANGAVLQQSGKPMMVSVGNAGCGSNGVTYFFGAVTGEEPVAVVLSVDGRLTATAIGAK